MKLLKVKLLQVNNKIIIKKININMLLILLIDICLPDSISKIDFISLLDESLPQYNLRANTIFSQSNYDWIKAPFYIEENEIKELTNQQILFTLEYFSKYLFF